MPGHGNCATREAAFEVCRKGLTRVGFMLMSSGGKESVIRKPPLLDITAGLLRMISPISVLPIEIAADLARDLTSAVSGNAE